MIKSQLIYVCAKMKEHHMQVSTAQSISFEWSRTRFVLQPFKTEKVNHLSLLFIQLDRSLSPDNALAARLHKLLN